MKSSNKNTEQSIREKLSQHEFELDNGMWENMDAMLDQEQAVDDSDLIGFGFWNFLRNNRGLLSLLAILIIGGIFWWGKGSRNMKDDGQLSIEEAFSEAKQDESQTKQQTGLNSKKATNVKAKQEQDSETTALNNATSQVGDSILKATKQASNTANNDKAKVIKNNTDRKLNPSISKVEKSTIKKKAIRNSVPATLNNKAISTQAPKTKGAENADPDLEQNLSIEETRNSATSLSSESGNVLSTTLPSRQQTGRISSTKLIVKKSPFVDYSSYRDHSFFETWNKLKASPPTSKKKIKPHKKLNRVFLGLGFEKAYFTRQMSQSIGDLNFRSWDDFSKYKVGALAYFQLNKKIRIQSEVWYYKLHLNYEVDAALDSDPFFFQNDLVVNRLEIPVGLHFKFLNRFRLSSALGVKLNFVKTPKPIQYDDNEIYEGFYNAIPNSYNRFIAFYDFGIGYDWRYFSIDIRQRYNLGNFLSNVSYNGVSYDVKGDNFQYVRIGISYFFGRHQ